MNLIINILLLILIISIFCNIFYKTNGNENFEIIFPELMPSVDASISSTQNMTSTQDITIVTDSTQNIIPPQVDNNFMFYQGTKPRGTSILYKPELRDDLNELVKTALSLPNCLSFTNGGEFYDSINLCYNKGPTSSVTGDKFEGTYIKSQIFEDYIINNC